MWSPSSPTTKKQATLLLPKIALQRDELYDYFSKSTTVAQLRTAPSLRHLPMTFTVPDRKLKKLLKSHGYQPSNRGKDSHEGWVRPGHQNVTGPRRTHQGGITFIKSSAEALGLNDLKELEELVRPVK